MSNIYLKSGTFCLNAPRVLVIFLKTKMSRDSARQQHCCVMLAHREGVAV